MTHSSVFIDRADWKELVPDYDEVYRYMGYHFKDRQNDQDGLRPVVYEVVEQFQKIIVPQSVYVSYPLEMENETLHFEKQEIKSRFLSKHLEGCHAVFLFAATIGPKVDREIQRCQKIDAARSVVMQAAGAMFIEQYCENLCRKFKGFAEEENSVIKNRFSPGYGDVSLEVQKIFFSLLGCRKIGLTLMDSLVMAPEKSVTAFVGVKHNA